MNLRKFVLMEGEPGAAGGGISAAGDPAAGGAPAGGQPAGDPAAASSLAKPVPLHERIPEKFHVKNGDQFDAEASMGKVLEGYQALEKRVGSGDLPPKDPGEYAVTLPEPLKESLKDFQLSPEFRKQAHDMGVTQKQMDFMMAEFFKTAPQLIQGGMQNGVDATRGALEKAWGAEYGQNLDGAMKAFEAYADPEDKGKFDEIMTNPALAYRLLAKVSREIGEAGGVPAQATGASAEDAASLMKSEAYWNPKHADHAKVSAKVRAHYEKKHGTAAVN